MAEEKQVETTTEETVPTPAPVPTPTPTPTSAAPTGVSSSATTTGSDVNGPMPEELKHWSWAAFLMNWLWGVNHKVWISLLVFLGFIPIIGPIIALATVIYLGVKGNELAWKNRKFESVEQFKAVQKAWTMWGVIIFIIGVILSIFMWAALIAFISHGSFSTTTSTTTTNF